MDEREDTKIDARDRNRRRYYDMGRKSYLKRTYGISLDDYNRMLEDQLYSCAICGNSKAGVRGKYNTFCVDHDHSTGKVRGLLCYSCNVIVVPAIEYYGSRLPMARLYLQRFQK